MNQDAAGQRRSRRRAPATSVSEDGLTYTFHLRPEAKWSNGDPVTAGDFVYAWQRAADPATASPYSWYIELMKVAGADAVIAGEAAPDTLGVRAVDDHTLEVTLETPAALLPADGHPHHHLPGAPGGRRGVRRPVDPARQHGRQRRLRPLRAGPAGAHRGDRATRTTGTTPTPSSTPSPPSSSTTRTRP